MIVAHHFMDADTPWQAAEKATGKAVKARTDERFWVRVTDQGHGPSSNTQKNGFERPVDSTGHANKVQARGGAWARRNHSSAIFVNADMAAPPTQLRKMTQSTCISDGRLPRTNQMGRFVITRARRH